MTIVATGCGMPRWRSMNRRKTRPSFSRKKVLKKKNDRKKAIDVSPLMPPATPFSSVCPMSGTEDLTSSVALSAPEEPTPRSCAQLWIRSAPLLRAAVISALFSTMPPITSRPTTATVDQQSQQHEARGGGPGHVPRQGGHPGGGDGGHDGGGHHRADDRGDLAEEPDQAEEQDPDAHQEPGEHPEIAQPGRGGEHVGQLARLELQRRGVLGGVAGLALVTPQLQPSALPRGTAGRRGCYPAPPPRWAPRGVTAV